MSTFQGIIKEIRGISVDCFNGENLESAAFFLSHCHTDHMRGLNTVTFREQLIQENKHLYLSNISAIILRALNPGISNHIKVLPLEQTTSVRVVDKYIAVTCIPAGHCPGSVMFLFETNNCTVLYTGDYRIGPSDISKFKCFYDSFGNVKIIDKIYLDTTFFFKPYKCFPTREESLSELCEIINSWISQDPGNCIRLDVSARYGYEYVFKEIYNNCKRPVHVDIDKYNFYSVIPELDECVTMDGSKTQIHSCQIPEKRHDGKLRIIKLSAFRWKNDIVKAGISNVDKRGIYYVCYSTHASYDEGMGLLNFLKPKDIHICVEWLDDPVATLSIKKSVDQYLKVNSIEVKQDEPPKLFETCLNIQSTIAIPKKRSKFDDILDSPPK